MLDKNFGGKKAVVVGATGGMGSVISMMLSAKGVNCALFGRDEKKLKSIRSACTSSDAPCFIFSCDISNPSSIKECSAAAIKRLKGLNFLVHCAGDYNKAAADDCDLETWDKILDVNLRSTYHFARYLLSEINKMPNGAVIRIN